METGSRKENASNKESRTPLRCHRSGVLDSAKKAIPPGRGPRGGAESVASGGFGVGLVGGRRGLGRTGTALQRKLLALIQRADAALIEACFIDLQVGAVQRIRRQLLDREANRFGRGAKSPIRKSRPLLLADRGGKQFGGSIEAESHGQGPLIFFVRTRLEIANGSHGRTESGGAGTRHFQDDFNISSFDRNATPEEPDDESGHSDTGQKISLVISMACVDHSLPSSSRMMSTTRMTPPMPIPEWPMP